ncbi:TIGR03086 family metal-binding protein [Amycolatopsis albispora]|uniref:TIGR03086 family protein n=1 Tax=Amycolatopsis albispora TaxID=1804986 RepID=A0A344LA12_9PSEU|nr:TIGR03086 family metal-binding protein [Amycolatopsis albispora]AXB44886.1 TIGR03086 family protein [Amycolatopsis albispora]
MTQPVRDPRPLFARSLDQTGRLIAAVRPGQLDHRTPCADYDVRALLGHVVSVLHKLVRAGVGTDAREVPDVLDGIDDWNGAFAEARAEVERIWANDELLDRSVTLPWATLPGRVALDAYTHEFTAHCWDLAAAIDQLAGLDADLAVQALDAFQKFAPPEERDGRGPFGPVVPTSDTADAYTRLAAYLGRRVPFAAGPGTRAHPQ